MAFLVLFAAGGAHADPAAEKLFRDGRDLLKAGRVGEACEAFARSQTLEPKVGTLLNLADCRERQGRTATAWSLFLEAKALAAQTTDRRGAEATRRASALEPRLAYVTLVVPVRVPGLVIKRDGELVDPAVWNVPVPLDPDDYVFEASAPGYVTWSKDQPLAPKARLTVKVGPLVAEPVVEPPPTEPPKTVAAAPVATEPAPAIGARRSVVQPRPRSLAVGVVLGTTSDEASVYGARIVGGMPLGPGSLRGVAMLLYDRFEEDGESLYSFSAAAEYVWMPVRRLGFGGGLGVGMDYIVSDDDGTDETGTFALRANPLVVRLLDGRIEAGLQLQLVFTDRTVVVGLVGLDVFML